MAKRSIGANTSIYPTPVLIVCSYDGDGKPNAMNAAWGGVCSSRPPSVAVSLRAATYSHGCILARKAFTVCIPSGEHVKEADYFGIVSGRDVNKFEKTGLTPVRSEVVDAPYVDEFPIVLECRLTEVLEVGLHTHFVGEVMDVKADEAILDAGGRIQPEKLKPMMFASDTREYYGLGQLLGKAFSIGKAFE